MQIQPLSINERNGFTHKCVLSYTDIAALTSGAAASIFPGFNGSATFPAGTRVSACAVHVSTACTFSPGTLVAIVGDGSDTDRFFTSTDMKTAAWAENGLTTKPYTYNAADTIDIIFTAGAGALTSVTAGEVIVYLNIEDLSGHEQ
jgi:hypothetical protein